MGNTKVIISIYLNYCMHVCTIVRVMSATTMLARSRRRRRRWVRLFWFCFITFIMQSRFSYRTNYKLIHFIVAFSCFTRDNVWFRTFVLLSLSLRFFRSMRFTWFTFCFHIFHVLNLYRFAIYACFLVPCRMHELVIFNKIICKRIFSLRIIISCSMYSLHVSRSLK